MVEAIMSCIPTSRYRRRERGLVSMQLLAPASDLERWYNYVSLQRASKLDAIIKRR